jgi:flagellar protein FlaJ
MPKTRKKRKPSLAIRLFSKVGGGVFRAGRGIAKVARGVRGVVRALPKRKPVEKVDEVTRRLRELKRLQMLREEELAAERKKIEERIWEERIELRRPLSERLAESFYVPLKRPALRVVKFFKGLDEDLFKAGLAVPAERYVALMIGMSIIVGIVAFILMWLFLPLPLALLGAMGGFVFTLMIGRVHPKSRARSRVVSVNRAIPYALRHMATQLSSGIGLPETMTSISQADYGALSEEFGRAVRDMHAGLSMDEALAAMDRRIESEPLRRAIRQIRRTMRTGGDLSSILGALADETAFDLRMKLRDYTQSLNTLTMIYMFASAVLPAMLIIMTIVTGFMGMAVFPPQMIALFYLVLLPFILFYFVLMIKRMEPRV